MQKILPIRMSTTACSFASHFGQQMAQNADLPISCKNFSGVTPPNPRPVLEHRAALFPDSHCFGSHNFQIVPARLDGRDDKLAIIDVASFCVDANPSAILNYRIRNCWRVTVNVVGFCASVCKISHSGVQYYFGAKHQQRARIIDVPSSG